MVVAGVNSLVPRMQAMLAARGWTDSIVELFGISAIVWFAFYGLVAIGLGAARDRGPGRTDWYVCGTLLALCLLPPIAGARLGLLVAAGWLLVTARTRAERGVGVIGLALTGPLVWGPLILRLMGNELLSLDAAIAGLLTGNATSGNLVIVPGDAPDVMIAAGCSALHNITPVFVLAATLSQLLGIALDRRLAWSCGVAVLVVVAINSVRLALIALYPQHYEYLHQGGGSALFSYATMLVVLAIIVLPMLSRPEIYRPGSRAV